ncbi:hypothetical protein M0804_013370 [Polistes exclamans]|nr:hypothetical protein M0804_013370 [Polistes exclamans]
MKQKGDEERHKEWKLLNYSMSGSMNDNRRMRLRPPRSYSPKPHPGRNFKRLRLRRVESCASLSLNRMSEMHADAWSCIWA